ncbi:MAG TPA: dynamin family protein [Candidatus Nanoarchaeia archaeon]|nr:dynamin family protein [Candidatus Nanoarchaeia archaeon]
MSAGSATAPAVTEFIKLERSLRDAEKDLSRETELQQLAREFGELAADVRKPPLVLVMGAFNAGKSTFLNALLGKKLLVTNVLPTTAAVTVLTYGERVSLQVWNRDGSCESHDIQDLATISAEGDPVGQQIRSKLKYLELSLPEQVLKRVTLVDTPGLNADNDLHTAATNEFQSRADAVIWLVAHGAPVNRFELSYIKTLPKSASLIAVVNQIDQHDEEEGPLEDVLQMAQARLENIPKAVVGISARDAMVALGSNDHDLLRRSRWASFQTLFQDQLLVEAAPTKAIRVLERTRELVSAVSTTFVGMADELSRAHRALHSRVDLKHDLQLQKRRVEKALHLWRRVSDRVRNGDWRNLNDSCEVPDGVADASRLNEVRKMLLASRSELLTEQDGIQSRKREVAARRDTFNREWNFHLADQNKYEHSGLFGNKPWFRHSEWGDRVERRGTELSARRQSLNADETRLTNDTQALNGRIQRFAAEVGDYCKSVVSSLDERISTIKHDLKNLDVAQEQAKEVIAKHRWVYRSAERIANANVWNIVACARNAAEPFAANGHATIVQELMAELEAKAVKLTAVTNELGTHRIPEERALPPEPVETDAALPERESYRSGYRVRIRVAPHAVLAAGIAAILLLVGLLTWWMSLGERPAPPEPNHAVITPVTATPVDPPPQGLPFVTGDWDLSRAMQLIHEPEAQVLLNESYKERGRDRRLLVTSVPTKECTSCGPHLAWHSFAHYEGGWALESASGELSIAATQQGPVVQLVVIGAERHGLKITVENTSLEIFMLGVAGEAKPVWASAPCPTGAACPNPDVQFVMGPISDFYDLQVVQANDNSGASLYRIDDKREQYACVSGPCNVDMNASLASSGTTSGSVDPDPTRTSDVEPQHGVQAFLTEWAASFKRKDVVAHLNCYGEKLDTYFLRHNVPHSSIEQEKQRAFSLISDIKEFSLSDISVSFNGSERATATFKKKWDTTLTTSKRYAGEEIQALDLQFLNGSWKITSEREVKILSVTRN